MLRFVLLWFFLFICIASHCYVCHCSVCVRLSHLIKDYLLTYLCSNLTQATQEVAKNMAGICHVIRCIRIVRCVACVRLETEL